MAGVSRSSKHHTRIRNSTKCQLLWHNKDHHYVNDATLFGDGLIVYITYEKEDGVPQWNTLELRVRDLKGNVTELPFSTRLTSPLAVCSSPDGSQLVVLDCVGDKESLVVVYSNTSQGLIKRQFATTEKVERVALLPAGECVCTTDMPHSRIVMFNREGDHVWSKSLPRASPDAATYPVLLRATPSGLSHGTGRHRKPAP